MQSNIPNLRRKILRWYQQNKRDLPWRENKNPYRIWISEIMLQQTQVQTVIPYYQKWFERFPTISKLAAAPLEAVLKNWEGLGYYSRARNIHQAAKTIVKEFSGKFPEDREEILRLPGIGKYTVGAISSIAFDKPEPILDGNVIRLLTRLEGIEENISDSKTLERLWQRSKEILSEKNPGDFNQALMEIGALICTPAKPSCLLCPVTSFCKAFSENNPEAYPVKTKTNYEKLAVSIGIIWNNKKILIQKRPPKGRMGGLWEFPGGKLEGKENPEDALHRELKEELGIEVTIRKKMKPIKHAYTRFRVTLHPFECVLKKGKPKSLWAEKLVWVLPQKLSDFPFPSANLKIIKTLEKQV